MDWITNRVKDITEAGPKGLGGANSLLGYMESSQIRGGTEHWTNYVKTCVNLRRQV